MKPATKASSCKHPIMRKLFIPALIIGFFALLFSCEDPECDESLRNDAGFAFVTIQDSIATDSVVDTISVFGLSRDSLLYDSSANQSAIYLPLDPSSDQSRFVIQIDSIADTLQINYIREERFISHACGFITHFRIQEATTTHNHFDSIATVNPLVTLNEDETHFNIYLSAADTSGL